MTIIGNLTIGVNGTNGTYLSTTGGALTLGGASILTVTGTTTGAGENSIGDYDIANYSSLTSGNTFASTTIPSGYMINYTGTSFNPSGDIELDPIAAVPEPSTWAGGLVGLGILGFHLRRRFARV